MARPTPTRDEVAEEGRRREAEAKLAEQDAERARKESAVVVLRACAKQGWWWPGES